MFARLLFVFAVFASPAFSSEDAGAIDFARQQTIEIAQKLWSNASQPGWGQAQVMRGIEQLLKPIRSVVEPNICDGPQFMSYAWARVEDKSFPIKSMYEAFLRFLDQGKIREQPFRAYLDIADGMLQDLTTLPEIHRRIFANDTVYGEIIKTSRDSACYGCLSTQMLLYNLYVTSQLTFLKAYVMAQSAWLIHDTQGKGSYWNDANNLTDVYQDLTRKQATLAKAAVSGASRGYWVCDPPNFRKGENYEEVQGLLQGYIENEVDMNAEESCRGGCHNYKVAENLGCFKNKFCSQQRRCSGRILNCGFVESDMNVCVPKNTSSDRRYEYISFEAGTLYGTARLNRECSLVTVDSWWRFLLPAHCTYCFCQCEESPENSERYFSLGFAESDIENHKVVTGVRFIKKDRTFYLQIQQGSLLPRGGINATTVEWVPVDENAPKFLMKYEQRNMDLDDIQAPKGYVLTGMRFRKLGSHLNPEIRVTPLDFDMGVLHRPTELSYWQGNDNTEHSEAPNTRTILTLPTADVDMNRGINKPDSKTNTYVQFGSSSFETDAAQRTIPFIDIQPVATKPATILSGAGIFHRGCEYMAGLVAPRIFTYDISQHIDGESQLGDNHKTA